MKKRYLVLFASCLVTMVALSVNICTWKGGDGKFSDSSKWDIMPANGDMIVFDTTDGNPISVENDIADDFTVRSITFKGASIQSDRVNRLGSVTISGKRIYISAPNIDLYSIIWTHGDPNDEYVRGPEVIVNAPLRLYRGNINISWTTTFNGDITIDDGGSLMLDWPGGLNYAGSTSYPAVTINGEVYGPDAQINNLLGMGGRGSSFHVNNKCVLKAIRSSDSSNCKVSTYLNHSENDIEIVGCRYGYMYINNPGSISEKTKLEHYLDPFGPGAFYFATTGTYVFDVIRDANGDPSCSQLVSPYPTDVKPVLHMKATDNATFYGHFDKGISIVYDPKGDFTYELMNSVNAMTGNVELKGGTFKLSGTTAFTSVQSFILHNGSTLSFADSTSETPINSSAELRVFKGGKVFIPEGKTITFNSVIYEGVSLTAGSYTQSNIGFIEGGGSINASSSGVVTWNDTAGGVFLNPENWTDNKVPSPANPEAYIINDASLTVEVEGGEYEFNRIYIGSQNSPYTNRLHLAYDTWFKPMSAFTINECGIYEQTSGFVSISNCSNKIQIENGGVWLVGGGTNVLHADDTDVYGPIIVKEGGSVIVTNGLLKLETDKANAPSFYISGGQYIVSGTGALDIISPNGIHTHGWGEIKLKDDASLNGVSIGISEESKELRYIFEDNSLVKMSQNVLAGCRVGGKVFIDFGSSNKNSSISGRILFGANRSNFCKVNVREGAISPWMNSQMVIGGYLVTAGYSISSSVTTGLCPTGIVNVAGTLQALCYSSNGKEQLSGLSVGSTVCPAKLNLNDATWSRSTTWPYGELNIEPTGFVTNGEKYVVAAGLGYGEGRINVRGGRLMKGGGSFIIGAGEGLGILNVTEGGSLELKSTTGYIGGVVDTDIGCEWNPNAYPHNALTSTGIVSVVDGSLKFINSNLNVGKQGTALINIGTNGLIEAANVSLLNSVETKIKYSINSSSGGKISASNSITVADGVKLEIDVTELPIKSVTLMEASQWNGEFASENIVISDAFAMKSTVRCIGNKLKFIPINSTMVIIK